MPKRSRDDVCEKQIDNETSIDYKSKIKIINNSYTKRRGTPQILQIYCNYCNNYIMTYQKDGPGELLRCYLDRIHLPENLNNIQSKNSKLECPECETVVGTPMIYEPENRPAYRMLKNKSFFKKIKL